jgi:bifunctional enzyme CysN/CysC
MDSPRYETPEKDLISSDISAYLRRHETKDLLRLLTCGSVDDGKSTLIGRLLYDTHMIYEDQLAAVNKDSKIYGTTGDDFDPALLMDGLKAEREQGITIDVAYRFFSTDRRKFIIADCPGHEQYTRNMATGASTCNLAVLLIDARHGVITQTRRHSFICSLLGIRHAVVTVNKMDLVDWSEDVFRRIVEEYNEFIARLNFVDIHFIPLSALKGDNVVEHSAHMPWYDGPTFLHHIENVNIASDRNLVDMRLPVQNAIRPDLNFRGFSGTLASGVLRRGDRVVSLPSRAESRIASIVGPDGDLDEAFTPQAVTVTLEDEIDVSRGSMLVPPANLPHVADEFEAMVVWMHEDAAVEGRSYLIKQTTNIIPGVLASIRYKVDVNTMRKAEPHSAKCMGHSEDGAAPHAPCAMQESSGLLLNEIGRVHITLHRPLAFDPYDRNRATGAFIVIDRVSSLTLGAGMIVDRVVSAEGRGQAVSKNIVRSDSLVSDEERRMLLGQRGATIWLTGLSGSGKSTVARELEKRLIDMGHACAILDGDNIRHGLNRDLGFSAEDRAENIRRIAEVARLFNDAGVIVITAFISPTLRDRAAARAIINGSDLNGQRSCVPTSAAKSARFNDLNDTLARFFEVFVDTPLEVCEERDPKGLYKKARAGEIQQFTGISAPYEPPEKAELVLNTAEMSVEQEVDAIVVVLRKDGVLAGSEKAPEQ